ncbi:MAG: hypothetical protein JXR76_03640 [Deltaproteobacteria bacterium]|nr:hypothetical protein [Deltaproteobacteria bacterium]
MLMRGYVIYLCFLVITFGAVSTRAQGIPEDASEVKKTHAKMAFDEGRELFTGEKYLEAAEAFRRAYDISPTWRLLFNIAQAETAAKRYGLAIEAFEQYLAEGGDEIIDSRSDEVMSEIRRLRMLVGTVAVTADSDAVLYVDNAPRGVVPLPGPVRVSIGTHTVKVEKEGVVLLETEVTVAGGMTTQVTVRDGDDSATGAKSVADEITMTPEPSAADNAPKEETPQRQLPRVSKPQKGLLVGGIVSAVLGVAGVTLGGIYSKKFADDNDNWEKYRDKFNTSGLLTDFNMAKKSHDDAWTDSIVLKVGFIAGGACLAAGTVLLILHAKRVKKSRFSWAPATGLGVTF